MAWTDASLPGRTDDRRAGPCQVMRGAAAPGRWKPPSALSRREQVSMASCGAVSGTPSFPSLVPPRAPVRTLAVGSVY